MAGSRLHKIGDIFKRTSGLLQTGAMKTADKPLWYDVYEAHPPFLVPTFERKKPEVTIKQLFYPEDMIRGKFFRKYGSPGTMSLNERDSIRKVNICGSFVQAYEKLELEQPELSDEELMVYAERELEAQGIYLDRSRRPSKASAELIDDNTRESRDFITSADLPEDVLRKARIADILKDTDNTETVSDKKQAAPPTDATGLKEITAVAASIGAVAAAATDVAAGAALSSTIDAVAGGGADVASSISDVAAAISDAATGVSDSAASGIAIPSQEESDDSNKQTQDKKNSKEES